MANAMVQDKVGASKEEDAARLIPADVEKAVLAVEKAAGREKELAEKGETRKSLPDAVNGVKPRRVAISIK